VTATTAARQVDIIDLRPGDHLPPEPLREPGESWLPIPDFDTYAISDHGRVWSAPRRRGRGRGRIVEGHFLRPTRTSSGAHQVHLRQDGRQLQSKVHLIVSRVFEGHQVQTERHGMADSPTYTSWTAMKTRCFNPNREDWPDYGGRGITVCERWRNSFLGFLEDMGERAEGTTLDRIDVNGNYSCGHCAECVANGWTANCRWSVADTQVRNRRKQKGTSSQYIGVSQIEPGRWLAYVKIKGQRHSARFDDEIGAARWRDGRVIDNNIDAPLNFPPEEKVARWPGLRNLLTRSSYGRPTTAVAPASRSLARCRTSPGTRKSHIGVGQQSGAAGRRI
jgi:hypothetical protein